MAERKTFLEIQYIIDDDCGMYRLGELDTHSSEAVENHIKTFGEYGYEQVRDFAIQMLMNAETQIRLRRKYNQGAVANASTP